MRNLRVAYSHGKGLLSWLIRTFTRSNVNHTLFLVDVNGTEMVIGADYNGLVMQTRARWERGGSRVVDVPPLLQSIDDGIPTLLKLLDEHYDYTGLLGMPIVLAGRFWFHRRWRNPFQERHALFCSEAAATIFQAVSYPGSKALDPGSTDPGYLMRWQHEVFEDHAQAA